MLSFTIGYFGSGTMDLRVVCVSRVLDCIGSGWTRLLLIPVGMRVTPASGQTRIHYAFSFWETWRLSEIWFVWRQPNLIILLECSSWPINPAEPSLGTVFEISQRFSTIVAKTAVLQARIVSAVFTILSPHGGCFTLTRDLMRMESYSISTLLKCNLRYL